MKKQPLVLVLSSLLLFSSFTTKQRPLLKAQTFKNIKVPEPSDIAFDESGSFLYIVSDNGILFECAPNGDILRKAAFTGMDFEGVEVVGDYVYVADESLRQIHKFRKKTLEKIASYYVPYSGGRNKGYESLAYNQTTKRFIVITEKDPIIIKQLNEDMIPVGEQIFKASRDISGARWYKGFMYLLSDEDRTIFKCDPETFEIIDSWKINVLNPEGIAFDKEGKLIIGADDLQRLYFFDTLK